MKSVNEFEKIKSLFSKEELLENQLRAIVGGALDTCGIKNGHDVSDIYTDDGKTHYPFDGLPSECDSNCP